MSTPRRAPRATIVVRPLARCSGVSAVGAMGLGAGDLGAGLGSGWLSGGQRNDFRTVPGTATCTTCTVTWVGRGSAAVSAMTSVRSLAPLPRTPAVVRAPGLRASIWAGAHASGPRSSTGAIRATLRATSPSPVTHGRQTNVRSHQPPSLEPFVPLPSTPAWHAPHPYQPTTRIS
jgi:hypothetical protein